MDRNINLKSSKIIGLKVGQLNDEGNDPKRLRRSYGPNYYCEMLPHNLFNREIS